MIEKIKRYLTPNNIIFACIVLLVGVGPILTYATKFLHISPIIVYSTYGTGFKTEVFNHCKFIFLALITTILLFTFIYKLLIKNEIIRKTPLNILILFFFSSIWISTALSDYKHIALFGNNDRFEGAISWTCYLFIFFILIQTKLTKKQINIILLSSIPFLLINVVLGILHFFEINVLQWEWLKQLIGYSADYPLQGSLWTTLYNPNFISGVGAMFFIGFMAYMLMTSQRKGIFFGLAILAFIIVLTSTSSNGFLTALVCFPIVIITMIRFGNKKELLAWSGTLFLTCFIALVGFSTINEAVWHETIGLFKKEAQSLQINKASNQIETTEEKRLPVLPQPGVTFGSGRVYIWKETLKLVKEKPLFGYGFDTYPYVVDNNQIEKISNLGTGNVIIDKPHNWYLTVAYGSGIVGLIGLASILLCGTIQTYKKWWIERKKDLAIPLFLAIIAFCFQALFNDSLVGSSILFWVLLGCCFRRYINEE
ncbi:MAG: O-antigen ligase family protein [Bacillaceae bacterium]